jgi:acetyltransferase-like isoleucine patch superfamily enzyme
MGEVTANDANGREWGRIFLAQRRRGRGEERKMNLSVFAARMGEWPSTIGLPWEYFSMRGCILDCRGPIEIDANTTWGFGVRVLTESHDINGGPGVVGKVISRGVYVENGAWIGSYALLVGCRIGAGAIVAAGTVVRCQDVAPGLMVAGNPARVIARWAFKQWIYVPLPECGFYRRLE